MFRQLTLAVGAAVLLVAESVAIAGTIHVPEDFATIQDAVDAASDADTVLLAPGVYTGIGNSDISLRGKSVVITSEHGADACIIEPDQSSNAVFYCLLTEEDTTAVISNLTIRNASCGVFLVKSTPRLANLHFQSCEVAVSANYDGGLNHLEQHLCIERCTFTDSRVAIRIGAVGYAIIDSCTFQRCDSIGIEACPLLDTCDILDCHFDTGGVAVDLSSASHTTGEPENLTFRIAHCGIVAFRHAVNGWCIIDSSSFINCHYGVGRRDIDENSVSNVAITNVDFVEIDTVVVFAAAESTIICDSRFVGNSGVMQHIAYYTEEGGLSQHRNCSFSHNQGTMFWQEDEPRTALNLQNCTFDSNSLSIRVAHAALLVDSCHFAYNQQPAIMLGEDSIGMSWGGTANWSIQNSVLTNSQGAVQGMLDSGHSLSIVGCTFSQNTGSDAIVGGDSGSAIVERCIFSHNSDTSIVVNSSYVGGLSLQCNDFYGNVANVAGVADPVGVNDNIGVNPLFCGQPGNEYALSDSSLCAASNSPCLEQIGACGVGCVDYNGPVWHVSVSTGSDIFGDGSESRPFRTIQRAIDQSQSNDTVMIHAGFYVGAGNRALSNGGRSLVIESADGSANTVIDIDSSGAPGFVLSGQNVVLRGFSVRNATSAVACSEANIVLRDILIEGCGVGMDVFSSAWKTCQIVNCRIDGADVAVRQEGYVLLTIDSTRFQQNELAIDQRDGNGDVPTPISGCTFRHNNQISYNEGWLSYERCQFIGGQDGMIAAPASLGWSVISLIDCVIDSLSGLVFGMGDQLSVSGTTISNCAGTIASIYNIDMETPQATFDGCSFESNEGDFHINGIEVELTLSQCTFTNCTGTISYGGWTIYPVQFGGLMVSNCTFTGAGGFPAIAATSDHYEQTISWNLFFDYEGVPVGIYRNDGQANVNIRNNTFVDCDTTVVDVEIWNGYVDPINVENNIIAHCVGPAIAFSGSYFGDYTVNCNDFFDNDTNFVGVFDLIGLGDNIALDPEFCGSTWDNFSLFDDSPCAPVNNSCSQLIGALPVNCNAHTGPIWHVAVGGDDQLGNGSDTLPFGSIQKAVDAATNGDTVLIAGGTYQGVGNRDISTSGKAIVIWAPDGATIDVEPTDSNGQFYRAFVFDGSEDTSTVIHNLNITSTEVEMSHDDGAGIYCSGASPLFRNCTIGGFWTLLRGGGVYLVNSAVVFDSCYFVGNTAGNAAWKNGADTAGLIKNRLDGEGGAIYMVNSSPNFIDCIFEFNGCDEGYGGGIYAIGGRPLLTNCLFERNESYYGGAIFCTDTVYVRDGRFERNSSYYGGGAVWGVLDCDSCEFVDNYGAGTGGAINGSGLFDWCVFRGNGGENCYDGGASAGGGAFTNCTFTGNSSMNGSIISPDALVNCIVSFNDTTEYWDWGTTITGTPYIECTDIYGNEAGDWSPNIANQLSSNGNISADPRFCIGTLELSDLSPCLPENNSCGILMGVHSQGCSVACCTNRTGNVNNDAEGTTDLTDLLFYVNYLFQGGPLPECPAAVNVNGDAECLMDLSDLLYLVNFLFLGGPDPASCMSECE